MLITWLTVKTPWLCTYQQTTYQLHCQDNWLDVFLLFTIFIVSHYDIIFIFLFLAVFVLSLLCFIVKLLLSKNHLRAKIPCSQNREIKFRMPHGTMQRYTFLLLSFYNFNVLALKIRNYIESIFWRSHSIFSFISFDSGFLCGQEERCKQVRRLAYFSLNSIAIFLFLIFLAK